MYGVFRQILSPFDVFSRETKISCRSDIVTLIVDEIIFHYKNIHYIVFMVPFTSHKGSPDIF